MCSRITTKKWQVGLLLLHPSFYFFVGNFNPMSYKENIVVVLFNPTISCIEQVLEFLSGFKGVSSKLHILNDLDSNKKMVSEEDLLILELSMPVRT